MRIAFALALTPFLFVACEKQKPAKRETVDAAAENKPFHMADEIDHAAIDSSVPPCADFYAYACGGWMKTNRIPDDEGMWSRSFHEIRARNEEILRDILERDVVAPPADEPYSDKLGDFFSACMDETAIDARGNGELTELLDNVDTKDADAIARSVARLHLLGVPSLFVLEPELNFHNRAEMDTVARQPPLTQSAESYTDGSIVAVTIAHATRLFELAGDSPARAAIEAHDAIELERELASAFEARAVFHDASAPPKIVYGDEIAKVAPNFSWKAYFSTLGIRPPALHVATPKYFSALHLWMGTWLRSPTTRASLRSLLRWELLFSLAPTLSSPLSAEAFQLERRRSGAIAIAPRWKRCVRATEDAMGDALAVPFVREALNADDVERVRAFTTSMKHELESELDSASWLDPMTREAARDKIDQLQIAIGNSREKLDYDALQVGRASFLADVVRARIFDARRKLAAIDRAAPEDAWQFSASIANAYFDPQQDKMVISGGLLAPPIFDSSRDEIELGALGTILGHEFRHVLDPRFSASGILSYWWSPNATQHHEKSAACVRKDLDDASARENLSLRSAQLVNESLADLGGLQLVYRMQEAPTSRTLRARDQAFFTAFAQVWCSEFRPEALHDFVAENAHAPPRVRVNRALADMPEFSAAFSCREGDAMMKRAADRCDSW